MSSLPKLVNQMRDSESLQANDDLFNTVMDDFLMKEFGQAMTLKMNTARLEGMKGWFDEEVLNDEYLKDMIIDSFNDKDWASVANYSAMLWGREKIREGSV